MLKVRPVCVQSVEAGGGGVCKILKLQQRRAAPSPLPPSLLPTAIDWSGSSLRRAEPVQPVPPLPPFPVPRVTIQVKYLANCHLHLRQPQPLPRTWSDCYTGMDRSLCLLYLFTRVMAWWQQLGDVTWGERWEMGLCYYDAPTQHSKRGQQRTPGGTKTFNWKSQQNWSKLSSFQLKTNSSPL